MLYAYGNHEDDMDHTMESLTSFPVVEAARKEFPGERVCIGIVENIDPVMYIRADDIIDRMKEAAHYEVDDLADGWLEDVSASQYQLLETKIRFAIRDWFKQTGNKLNAHVVRDVEWYEP